MPSTPGSFGNVLIAFGQLARGSLLAAVVQPEVWSVSRSRKMTHPATTNSTLTSNSVSYRGTALRTVGRAWSTRPRVVEASSLFSPSWTMAISRCNWHHLQNFCRLFVESALTQINQMLLGPGICRLDLHQLRLGWAAPSSGRRRGRDAYRPSGDVLCPIAGFCQRRGAVSTLRQRCHGCAPRG